MNIDSQQGTKDPAEPIWCPFLRKCFGFYIVIESMVWPKTLRREMGAGSLANSRLGDHQAKMQAVGK
jgi:hypothetical protein